MEIALLTSSRADFGFYQPLLKELKREKKIQVKLVAFGTHLSKAYGYTISQIIESGHPIFAQIKTHLSGDGPEDIVRTIANVNRQFSSFWKKNKFDLILCLGDRYEMFAAVSSSVPFNIPVAHLSGGEQTLGAIDNFYRNALTLIATYHFTNTRKNAERVKQLKGESTNVYHTGSLAVDNIKMTKLYTLHEFKKKFHFNLDTPFILFTFHPETVNFKLNSRYADVIKELFEQVKVNVLVTMPNADTMGNTIRRNLISLAAKYTNIHLVESLGSAGYYTALKYCMFVMGNSSSGIVEAASFQKYVINMGNRQLGREKGNNILDVPMQLEKIIKAMAKISQIQQSHIMTNIYGDGKAAKRITQVLKKIK